MACVSPARVPDPSAADGLPLLPPLFDPGVVEGSLVDGAAGALVLAPRLPNGVGGGILAPRGGEAVSVGSKYTSGIGEEGLDVDGKGLFSA